MSTPTEAPERLLTRPFVVLGLAELAYFTAVGAVVYALPLYVTGPIGSDNAGAGVAFGAFAVSALLLRPFAGRLTDRVGRRPLLVGGALLCAGALALMPVAHGLVAVVALRLVMGVAEAAFFVAGFAALADLAPPSRMGEALSYNSLGLYLGLTLGPPLGEVLVTAGGYTTAWLGASVLAAAAAALAVLIGETRTATPEAGKGRLIHRGSVPIAAAFCTSLVAMGGFLAFAALRAGEIGLDNASVPVFAYGAVVVVCRIVFARLPDRLPPLRLGAAALATIAAGLAVVAAWATPTGMLLGAVVMGVGITFSTPAFFAAMFATAGPGERGAVSGTASAFMDLGLGAGPIVLGVVARSLGIAPAFGVAAGVVLMGAVWAAVLVRGVDRSRRGA